MQQTAIRDVMTPEQVADYLQLATETVYRLIRQRKLATTRVGRAYRIPRQDVESFIVANSTREEVRRLLFRRVMTISDRSDGERDGDALLESLEASDEIGSGSHAN
ncbi:MAG: helix-turn-helix domain-containing protein [Anaerolineae bacterium]